MKGRYLCWNWFVSETFQIVHDFKIKAQELVSKPSQNYQAFTVLNVYFLSKG